MIRGYFFGFFESIVEIRLGRKTAFGCNVHQRFVGGQKQIFCGSDAHVKDIFTKSVPHGFAKKLVEICGRKVCTVGKKRKADIFRLVFGNVFHGVFDDLGAGKVCAQSSASFYGARFFFDKTAERKNVFGNHKLARIVGEIIGVDE